MVELRLSAIFLNRHGVGSLSMQVSAAIMEVEPFKKRFQEVLEERGLSREQVFNADESGLYWKLMPSKTLVTFREKDAKAFKQSKDRVTIMACANACGIIKLPLVFIHNYANPRCFKNIDKKDFPVQYFNQRNAWMDSSIFNNWFHNSFVPFCRKALIEKGLPQKAMLFLDNALSHPDVK